MSKDERDVNNEGLSERGLSIERTSRTARGKEVRLDDVCGCRRLETKMLAMLKRLEEARIKSLEMASSIPTRRIRFRPIVTHDSMANGVYQRMLFTQKR